MKYDNRDLPDWYRVSDMPPQPPRRGGLLEIVGNLIGASLIFAGIVLLIVILHFAPDSALISLWSKP